VNALSIIAFPPELRRRLKEDGFLAFMQYYLPQEYGAKPARSIGEALETALWNRLVLYGVLLRHSPDPAPDIE
jgi:hypothetical protein